MKYLKKSIMLLLTVILIIMVATTVDGASQMKISMGPVVVSNGFTVYRDY